MKFQKGMPRPANSGRKRGSRNKINQETTAMLADLGCNPIEGMALIAMDPKNELSIRARMYAELAEYVKPKLSRHEVIGPIGTDGTAGPIKLEVEYINKPTPE